MANICNVTRFLFDMSPDLPACKARVFKMAKTFELVQMLVVDCVTRIFTHLLTFYKCTYFARKKNSVS